MALILYVTMSMVRRTNVMKLLGLQLELEAEDRKKSWERAL